MNKKRVLLFILSGILAILGAGVCIGWIGIAKRQSPGIILHGNVDDRQIKLAFQIPERIESILVEEGDRVRKGQILGKLESVRIRNDLQNALAARDHAKAVFEKIKNGSREEDVAIAQAEVEAVRAKLKAAEKEHSRKSSLLKGSATSIREADQAEASCLSYRAILLAAENNLRKLRNGSRKEEIDAAKAQLDQMEAQLAIQQQKRIDCELKAPVDAIVRNRILEPGEMSSPQTPALVLAIVSPKWVRTYLPEMYLTRIRNGDRAIVRFDGAEGTDFEGWVGFISPNAEFTPKNVETPEIRTSLVYEMRVFVKDPDNRLKLGGPATVLFPNKRTTP